MLNHISRRCTEINSVSGPHVARKLKIWQGTSFLPARDAVIERKTGDTQMDVDDAFLLSIVDEHVL